MNNAIKKLSSTGLSFLLALLLFIAPSNVLYSNAEDGVMTYNMPVCYFYEYTPSAANSLFSGIHTVNVQATLSTPTLQQGTVVTLTGIPTDSIYFEVDDFYTVEFAEGGSLVKTYGGWYNGDPYENGTITYVMQTGEPTLKITFGSWRQKEANGLDSYYVINADGTMTGSCYEANDPDRYAMFGEGYNVYLETFVLNSDQFNALSYYMDNPDLQTQIGPNPQNLYNHWLVSQQ